MCTAMEFDRDILATDHDVGWHVNGEQNRGLVVPEVEHEKLPQLAVGDADALLEEPWGLVLSGGHVQGDFTPGRGCKSSDLREQFPAPATQRDERL